MFRFQFNNSKNINDQKIWYFFSEKSMLFIYIDLRWNIVHSQKFWFEIEIQLKINFNSRKMAAYNTIIAEKYQQWITKMNKKKTDRHSFCIHLKASRVCRKLLLNLQENAPIERSFWRRRNPKVKISGGTSHGGSLQDVLSELWNCNIEDISASQ